MIEYFEQFWRDHIGNFFVWLYGGLLQYARISDITIYWLVKSVYMYDNIPAEKSIIYN